MATQTISIFEYYYVYIKSLLPSPHRAYYDKKLVIGVVEGVGAIYRLTFADNTVRIVAGADWITVENVEEVKA
jgi:hypothetical protein